MSQKASPGNGGGGEGAARSPRTRLWTLLPLAIFAGLAVVFVIGLFLDDDIPSVLIGQPAPATELPPLAGLTAGGVAVPGFSSAEFGNGAVTILNVFASWCGPCRDEHPALMALANDPRFRIVGLNYKDLPSTNPVRWLGGLGSPYDAVGVDADGRAAIDWGVYGVPETFIIDAAGIIRHKAIGPIIGETGARFAAALAAVLAE